MTYFLICLLAGAAVPFLLKYLIEPNPAIVSPVTWVLELLWAKRLRIKAIRAQLAFKRLTTNVFWKEAIAVNVGLMAALGLTLALAPSLLDNAGGLFIGGGLGLLGSSLVQLLIPEVRVAFNQQDDSYLEAVLLLPEMSPEDAEKAVLAALPEANAEMLRMLQNYCEKLGLDTSSHKLMLALKSTTPTQYYQLLKEVYQQNPGMLVPHLEKLLTDDLPAVRYLGIQLLLLIPAEERTEISLRMLNRKDDNQRLHFVEALQEQPELVDDQLIDFLLSHRWPRLRLSGALIVAGRKGHHWGARLAEMLRTEPYEYVRVALLNAIQNFPLTDEALNQCLHILNGGYDSETTKAAIGLLKGAAGHPQAGEAALLLARMLTKANLLPSTSQLVIDTLEALGPGVMSSVLQHLESKGLQELLMPHLLQLNLPSVNAWEALNNAKRTGAWLYLIDALRQEDRELRTAFIIGNLLSDTLSVKLQNLQEIAAHPSIRYLPALEHLEQRIQKSLRDEISFEGTDSLAKSERYLLLDIQKQMRDVAGECLLSQPLTLRLAGGKAYCTQCRRRCQQLLHNSQVYTCCPVCLDGAHAVPNVLSVIGRIGGPLPESSTHTLYVGLWSEARKAAQPAEINTLELAPDPTVTHDWAITALLEANQKQGILLRGVKVRLIDDIVLSTNSQRILRDAGLVFDNPTDATAQAVK